MPWSNASAGAHRHHATEPHQAAAPSSAPGALGHVDTWKEGLRPNSPSPLPRGLSRHAPRQCRPQRTLAAQPGARPKRGDGRTEAGLTLAPAPVFVNKMRRDPCRNTPVRSPTVMVAVAVSGPSGTNISPQAPYRQDLRTPGLEGVPSREGHPPSSSLKDGSP